MRALVLVCAAALGAARVSEAFRTIASGGGDYAEDDGMRRYRFEGFDIIVRADSVPS